MRNCYGCLSTLTAARSAAAPVESRMKVEIHFEVTTRQLENFFARTAKKMIFFCKIC
jgi:hypothetical protein